MILVDTSVWVDHLRQTDAHLQDQLSSRRVLCHPFVIGELALDNLRDRSLILRNLARLPGAVVAMDNEVLAMIESVGLAGCGIGYIDAHLLAAARLSGASLWARDKRLAAVAASFGIGYSVP